MRLAIIAVLLFYSAIGAQPKPEPKLEQRTYRVTGLFSPDREKVLRASFQELAPEFKLLAVNFDEAEVTIEFSPMKQWPNQKPERVTELLNDKVRSVTHSTFGIKPRREVARDKLTQIVIPATGLDCQACCLAAYEAIAAIDGVYQATASFKDGKITARIDPTKTNQSQLEAALKKKGVDLGPVPKK